MAIRLVIAVTDSDWFEQLREQPDLDEVNFWVRIPTHAGHRFQRKPATDSKHAGHPSDDVGQGA